MSVTATNGKPARKQLSDQLDRLDGIIDALAEGLNQAVADACREGARQAIRDAVVEVLTNPELRTLLAALSPAPVPPAPAAPEPKKPGAWSEVKARIAAAREALAGAAREVKAAVLSPLRSAIAAADALGRVAGFAVPWRRTLLVGAATGVTVGAVCLVVPHTFAAAVGALGAATTSVAVQTGVWLRRAAKCFGLLG